MDILQAVTLAARLHGLQVDKCGDPYVAHCVRVMLRLPACASDTERIAAVLHDVFEDVPDARLSTHGVPLRAIQMVRALTRREGESYDDYIIRVAKAEWARRIKIADLQDNLDPSRLGRLPEGVRERLRAKYAKALAFLETASESGRD